jgi:1,4-alpha-glucan branching enzyme
MEELKLWIDDPWLEPWKRVILDRYRAALLRYHDLAGPGGTLYESVNSHLFYGFHREGGDVAFREWAPNAEAIWLIGDMNGWKVNPEYRFVRLEGGNHELILPAGVIKPGQLYKWYMEWPGGSCERLPAYATRCVQDPETLIFSAEIPPEKSYSWKNVSPSKPENLLIYEAHIGMSSEDERVATFNYFRENVLPRVASGGYNTLQLMAIQEHPYYGSFGYQVSNFFAVSSRFGTPDELRMLIDEAHGMNISVILDIVHSHSVSNVTEGLSRFDGTESLYFHEGSRGRHPAWDSRCFNYGKEQVLNFLLSNCKYWLEEFKFDGFRFDGITSMLYYDHGLGRAFTDYGAYFDGNQDVDALTYLTLANLLIKEIRPDAITIAEDMSGYPGLAAPFTSGGMGFGYRMSMGVADAWIRWIKELRDEDWNVQQIYRELTDKRADEMTVSYAECHDQAMVGDKTIIFRLLDSEMYTSMSKDVPNILIDRGVALHKMIRLITLATAGNGYLNFMGNEFGHPEWIDFPRAGNNWSYFYARRQWSLADNRLLRYEWLLKFDRQMISLAADYGIFASPPRSIYEDTVKQVLAFERNGLIFVFNFSPVNSYTDYLVRADAGRYRLVLDTDSAETGGFGRNNPEISHFSQYFTGGQMLSLYLPSRSAIVLKREI